ncbi:MAG: xylose isomerase [Gemmatimonadetes bacterium]|nr:xylose isomerase [Gemmatimonadota bacterium]|tara:strand:+ start:1181 stop:2044 length:864 start_codon:yes stop_codon:yes gene_type:complete
MAKKRVEKPVIRHMCSIGTLGGYGGKKGEWSVDQKLRRIHKAGFDGFLGRIPMITREHVEKSGLIFAATTDIGGIREIKGKLCAIDETGARCVNVQMLDHDTPTRRAVEVARRVIGISDELGMDVAIEVHRDTCTETPEKAYALAAGFEKAEKRPLKMTWDFSHPAVVKHLNPPYWDRLAEREELIQLAQQFHFRPFNGHHAQVPALNCKGELTPEFLDFMEFADRLIGCWMQAATPGREMFACPEQIAGGYMLSVFGDRFKDVQVIREQLGKSFKRHAKKWKPPKP